MGFCPIILTTSARRLVRRESRELVMFWYILQV
jgi:hypothetical protein